MIENYFWEDESGRIYSSAVQSIVPSDDPGYLTFVAIHGAACPWPRDEKGAETDEALQDVLSLYGLRLSPMTLDQTKAARVEALTLNCSADILGGYQSSALGAAHTYPSGMTDQINMMGSVTASLLPSLSTDWTTPFWCADSAGLWDFRAHTAAQIQLAGSDGKAHVVACQDTLKALTVDVMASKNAAAVAAVVWPA